MKGNHTSNNGRFKLWLVTNDIDIRSIFQDKRVSVRERVYPQSVGCCRCHMPPF